MKPERRFGDMDSAVTKGEYVLFYHLLCETMETQLSGNEALKLQALML